MELQTGHRTWLGQFSWTPLGVAARINPNTGLLMTPYIYQAEVIPDIVASQYFFNFRVRNANTGKTFRLVSREAITKPEIRRAWEVDAKGRPIYFTIIPERIPQV